MPVFQRFLLTISLLLFLPACADPEILPALPSAIPSSTPLILPPAFPTLTATLAPSETPTITPTLEPTLNPTPTETATPEITPTPVKLRGEVLEQANCRYGPGAPYLYKYGLVKGNRLEIIGRREDGQWIYVQAIGGSNPCWVKTTLMQVNGDVMSLETYYPEKAPLPKSPYYPATGYVNAFRNGGRVEVSWQDVPLRAGDEEDENMLHYVVEVWRCEAGQIIFEPLATNELSVTFADEAGCSQPSRGRVFVQEKHGFAGPAEIPWP
jgi:hypothetical protein